MNTKSRGLDASLLFLPSVRAFPARTPEGGGSLGQPSAQHCTTLISDNQWPKLVESAPVVSGLSMSPRPDQTPK
jgi:hypothetical protein